MIKEINIHPYKQEYKDEVITLLKINTPKYFSPEEEEDLFHYLDNEVEWYYVVFCGEILVGAGGINIDSTNNLAKISWDILHPAYQGLGIGARLLQYRVEQIKEMPAIDQIVVRTSQHVYRFYEKGGFKLMSISKDYWAKGFDMYYMVSQG